MRTPKDLLKSPFIHSAIIFSVFGVLMVRCPENAVFLAFWPLLLISVVIPLGISFRTNWWAELRLANSAVILGWLVVIVLAKWLAPSDFFWKGGEFWRLALFYPYAVLLSAILHLLRTPVKRAVHTYTTRRM